MPLTEIIKKVDDMIDGIKYYKRDLPSLETLEDLQSRLNECAETIQAEKEIAVDDLEIRYKEGFGDGYDSAAVDIVEKVLKNSDLKTRGEMIEKAEEVRTTK